MAVPPGARRPPVTDRPLAGVDDAHRLRRFLMDTYALAGRPFNWEARRWEGMFWTVSPDRLADPAYGAGAHVWHTTDGSLVAAAIPDGPGDLALQVDPDHRWVEDDVLSWAERHLPRCQDGERVLDTWAFDWDAERRERLEGRGYVPVSGSFWQLRRRAASQPVGTRPLPRGYTLRAAGRSWVEAQRWVQATNAVFGQATTAEEYATFMRSPSFDPELHVVVEAPDGSVAAFAGLTVDDANRTAVLEPVGALPQHRRLGLAQAAILEGMRRLAQRPVDWIYVANWGTADAARLYESVDLAPCAIQAAWRRVLS
ncbi:MAG TPA: GNAT family N-acetyltransferase [Candidatus Nanopelagicales bacterium]